MNIYFCDAGEMEYTDEVIDDYARYEWGRVCDFVAAETRGKARAWFINYKNHHWHVCLEWTDQISVMVIAKGMDIPAGEMHSDVCYLSEALRLNMPMARLMVKEGRLPTRNEARYIDDVLCNLTPPDYAMLQEVPA